MEELLKELGKRYSRLTVESITIRGDGKEPVEIDVDFIEPCTCSPECPPACRGGCGSKGCLQAYSDFLSGE
jgi:hypothetical protein